MALKQFMSDGTYMHVWNGMFGEAHNATYLEWRGPVVITYLSSKKSASWFHYL